jgi:hypothetical protein
VQRLLDGRVPQGRLPDPRLSLDHQGARARAGTLEEGPDRTTLGLPIDHRHRWLVDTGLADVLIVGIVRDGGRIAIGEMT